MRFVFVILSFFFILELFKSLDNSNTDGSHSCRNIQNNMFSGIVPPELGNLVNLENMSVCSVFHLGDTFLVIEC
jgi:hypothetical protein